MGEIADQMVNGEICAVCGVDFEQGETVYEQCDQAASFTYQSEALGLPVVCNSCR